jgi:hypothetical protein
VIGEVNQGFETNVLRVFQFFFSELLDGFPVCLDILLVKTKGHQYVVHVFTGWFQTHFTFFYEADVFLYTWIVKFGRSTHEH